MTTLFGLFLVLPAAWAATANVTIKDSQFGSGSHQVFIHPDDRVVWRHRDGSTPHTVTSDDQAGPGSFDSSPNAGTCSGILPDDCMREGDTFSHTFRVVGVFGYRCKVHDFMTGEVRVVEKGQPTSSTSASASSASPTPKRTSPSPTATTTATGTGSPTASPTGSASPTVTNSPRAGGGDGGASSGGRVAVAAVGVALLGAAGFLVYRRFLASP